MFLLNLWWQGKACECKSLHWKFSDKRDVRRWVPVIWQPVEIFISKQIADIPLCLPMCSLTHVLIALDLPLEQWDIDSHTKEQNDRPWQDCVQKVENLTWSDSAPSNKGMLFFQFDYGFPPWRLLGTKSRWSGFSTKNNCCSLWLLQSRGEEALSISVWQCVLCWSGNCAQQCVKLILYSQIINNHSLSCRLFQHF